jgi:hypothetical protein
VSGNTEASDFFHTILSKNWFSYTLSEALEPRSENTKIVSEIGKIENDLEKHAGQNESRRKQISSKSS